jgi:hypothetical protein
MVYIWIRAPIPWEDRQAAMERVDPEFRPKIDVWNATFEMPYHVFRQRLCEIAELSRSRVEGAVVAEWDEIPDGALVLPVDDDDWFAPEVARVVESAYHPPFTGCYWISDFLERPIHFPHRLGLIRRRIFPRTRLPFVLTTNNYAMVKAAENEKLLRGHATASAWLDGEGAGRMHKLERHLSLHNRTIASQTTMKMDNPTVRRGLLLRKRRAYKRLYRRRPRPGLEWSRPYVAMMAELMEDLQLRDGG